MTNRPSHHSRHASEAPPRPVVSGLFFLLFFGVMCYESARLFWPFIGSIGSAIVLAVVFRPWYDGLGRIFPRWPASLRALILDFIIVILFVIPIAIFVWMAVAEMQDLYPVAVEKLSHAGTWLHQNPVAHFPWLKKLPPSLVGKLNVRSEQFRSQLEEGAQRGFTLLAAAGTFLARSFLNLSLFLVIMIFCLFFMFRDGERMYSQAVALIPLSDLSKARLGRTVQRTIVSVVRGTFLMSLAQTLMMVIGLLVVHAKGIVLLSFLTFIATFIPSVGTAVVSVPTAIFFFLIGVHWKGIVILIWGTLGMGTIDNVLRPFVAGGAEEMSMFWILFSILGGLEVFGITGLLLGPLILSLMPVVFEIYRDRYLDIPED